jgi:hypothetical protein
MELKRNNHAEEQLQRPPFPAGSPAWSARSSGTPRFGAHLRAIRPPNLASSSTRLPSPSVSSPDLPSPGGPLDPWISKAFLPCSSNLSALPLPVTVSPRTAPAVRSPEQTAAASEPRPQRRSPGPLLTQGERAGAAEPWRPMNSTRRVGAERPRHGRRAVNKTGGWARACALRSWNDRVVIVAARLAGA